MPIEYNKFTLQDFRDEGYKVYRTKNACTIDKDWAFWLVQKKVYINDNEYFINVFITDYDLPPWNGFSHYDFKQDVTYTIKIQCCRENITFNLDIFGKDWYDISEIEVMCIKFFKFMEGI